MIKGLLWAGSVIVFSAVLSAALPHIFVPSQTPGPPARVVDDQMKPWGEDGVKKPVYDAGGNLIGYTTEYPYP